MTRAMLFRPLLPGFLLVLIGVPALHAQGTAGFFGTTTNTPFEISVNNERVVRLEPGTATEGPNVILGWSGNGVAMGVVGAAICGGGDPDRTGSPEPNRVEGDYGTVGGGLGNVAAGSWSTVSGGNRNKANATYSTVGGGLVNEARAAYSTVGGGGGNRATADYSTVGGGRGNVAIGSWSIISGGDNNDANADYATIGGGLGNVAGEYSSTVGGGSNNEATAMWSTVGGGRVNEANADYATVGGGDSNTARAIYATVGGGDSNTASGNYATVSGGVSNTASGVVATVAGGQFNAARGDWSFAAGWNAKANHQGSFVWADRSRTGETDTLATSGGHQFLVRSAGGVTFYSNSSESVGVVLNPGAGAWSTASDRTQKTAVEMVDPQAVLRRLAEIEIATWRYKDEAPGIRHMGPMAQDFYAAFGLGADERHIVTVDADGVALAAIQGLYAVNQALQEQSRRHQAKIAALEAELTTLRVGAAATEARLAALEATLGSRAPASQAGTASGVNR